MYNNNSNTNNKSDTVYMDDGNMNNGNMMEYFRINCYSLPVGVKFDDIPSKQRQIYGYVPKEYLLKLWNGAQPITSLMQAIIDDNEDLVKEILKNNDKTMVNMITNDINVGTLLHVISINLKKPHFFKYFQILLDNNADPNIVNNNGARSTLWLILWEFFNKNNYQEYSQSLYDTLIKSIDLLFNKKVILKYNLMEYMLRDTILNSTVNFVRTMYNKWIKASMIDMFYVIDTIRNKTIISSEERINLKEIVKILYKKGINPNIKD